jgi:hypothetical protein
VYKEISKETSKVKKNLRALNRVEFSDLCMSPATVRAKNSVRVREERHVTSIEEIRNVYIS